MAEEFSAELHRRYDLHLRYDQGHLDSLDLVEAILEGLAGAYASAQPVPARVGSPEQTRQSQSRLDELTEGFPT